VRMCYTYILGVRPWCNGSTMVSRIISLGSNPSGRVV